MIYLSDKKEFKEDMTIKEFQFLIKHIEQGSLKDEESGENPEDKKENSRRLILKLIEEFGELAENVRKNIRYDGGNIKGTIEEELFDIFYYIAAIANDYGIDLEDIFYIKDKVNIVKYKREFTIEEGREKYRKIKEKV